jgi:hypothetical protein
LPSENEAIQASSTAPARANALQPPRHKDAAPVLVGPAPAAAAAPAGQTAAGTAPAGQSAIGAAVSPPAARKLVPDSVAGGTVATASSDEIAGLDRALAHLRRERNPAAALVALDAYLARFPNGVLSREARLARIDALLLLHRSDELLAALESLPVDSGRRYAELLVIRAELRSRSSCERAEDDFSAALTNFPCVAR